MFIKKARLVSVFCFFMVSIYPGYVLGAYVNFLNSSTLECVSCSYVPYGGVHLQQGRAYYNGKQRFRYQLINNYNGIFLVLIRRQHSVVGRENCIAEQVKKIISTLKCRGHDSFVLWVKDPLQVRVDKILMSMFSKLDEYHFDSHSYYGSGPYRIYNMERYNYQKYLRDRYLYSLQTPTNLESLVPYNFMDNYVNTGLVKILSSEGYEIEFE